MGVYIKGLKMPKKCAECKRARLQFYIKCEEHENLSNGLQMKMRSLTCPMTELPPHGRLIDALEINEVKWGHTDTAWQRGWNSAIDAILENAQTIIEAEEVSE